MLSVFQRAFLCVAMTCGISLSVANGFDAASVEQHASVKTETLLQTKSSWDDVAYQRYPEGAPLLSVLKITIPPRTALAWHTHQIPNAAYVLSGELRVEKRDEGLIKYITEGEVLAEMVGSIHRGVTGDKPVVLIVFYAGAEGIRLSDPAK